MSQDLPVFGMASGRDLQFFSLVLAASKFATIVLCTLRCLKLCYDSLSLYVTLDFSAAHQLACCALPELRSLLSECRGAGKSKP